MTYAHQVAVAEALPVAAASLRMRTESTRAEAKAWREKAHPPQVPPDGAWRTWYVKGGRGGGKTFTGSHTLAEWLLTEPPGEWGIVAPTYGDGRDTCIEGKSGLLAALGTTRGEVDRGASKHVRYWNRSMGELRMRNGSVVYVDGADDGALRVQGKNLRGAWCDEVGLWKRNNWELAWRESVGFAVRLAPSRIIATGTPKRGHPLVKLLNADPAVPKSLLPTMGNADNLDPDTLAMWHAQYNDTTLGRQELGGEVLEDPDDALWKRYQIVHGPAPQRYTDGVLGPAYTRTVVAVDPTATSKGDACGIAAMAKGIDGRAYVLADRTRNGSPSEWGKAAVDLYHEVGAALMVMESNQGGEMAKHVITTLDPTVNVKLIPAVRSKWDRAEPVQALYEQGKVTHVIPLTELEDEQCSFTPESILTDSPNRVDALVHGLTDLMLKSAWGSGPVGGVA